MSNLQNSYIHTYICICVYINEMKFRFMFVKGRIDGVFILRRLQEEYHAKGKKLYIWFVDLD